MPNHTRRESTNSEYTLSRSTHDNLWKTIHTEPGRIPVDKNRRGWRTVRLFLSATVSDFQNERQKMATQIIPQLRMWCENRKIQLIEVDLQWSKESRISETAASLEMSMIELKRCREENVCPFFLSLLSEKYGWVPPSTCLTKELMDRYSWLPGFSQNAMEIVFGAYIDCNPNALICMRDSNFISKLASKDDFVDENHKEELNVLKERLRQHFPPNQVMDYTLDIDCDMLGGGKLKGISELCSDILTFFKKRISEQYPDPENAVVNAQSVMFTERRLHTQFVDIRSSAVYGRGVLQGQVMAYIGSAENTIMALCQNCNKKNATNTTTTVLSMPVIQKQISMFLATAQHKVFVMHGNAGAGKSSLVASCCRMSSQLFPGLRIFYHFVGAGGGSTDLVRLLRRLFMELAPDIPIPTTEEDLVRASPQMLKRSGQEGGLVIFIDALNQLDMDAIESHLAWLPVPLPAGVRCILSMITGTKVHQMITNRAPAAVSVEVGALDNDSCAEIVHGYLGLRNRSISSAHEKKLLAKRGAQNPLWLVTACEELRIHRSVATTDNKIESFSDSLLGLLQQVLTRIEEEHGKDIVKATLCFLECSRHGLLETELLVLLAEPRNYTFTQSETYKPTSAVSGIVEVTSSGVHELQKQLHCDAKLAVQDELTTDLTTASKIDAGTTSNRGEETKLNPPLKKQLATASWSPLYQSLQPFLRPCGEPGEGRLDFFHRAVSKAVRLRYLSRQKDLKGNLNDGKINTFSHSFSDHDGSTEKDKDSYAFWHSKLADHFEACCDHQRKAEELPYHLEKILSVSRLLQVLANWDTFNAIYTPTLYHEDNTGLHEVLYYGRQAGGFNVVAEMLEAQMQMWEVSCDISAEEMALRTYVIGKFLQKAGKELHATALLSARISDEAIANTVTWADICATLAEALVTIECGKGSGRQTSVFRRSMELSEGALSIYKAQNPLPWRAVCKSTMQVIECELFIDYNASTQFISRIKDKIQEVETLALEHNAKDILASVQGAIASVATLQKRSSNNSQDYMHFFHLVNEHNMLAQKYMEQSSIHITEMCYSSTFFNRGLNYEECGDNEKAEVYYRQSVITADSITSSDHPWSKYHRRMLTNLLNRLDGRAIEATEIENGGIVHPPSPEQLADFFS